MTKEEANECRTKGTDVWFYDFVAKSVRCGKLSMCCAIQSSANMFDVHVGEFYYFTKKTSGLFFTKLECLEATFDERMKAFDELIAGENTKPLADEVLALLDAIDEEKKVQLHAKLKAYADRYLRKLETPYFVDCPELGQKVRIDKSAIGGLYVAQTTNASSRGTMLASSGSTPDEAVKNLIEHVTSKFKDNSPAFAKFVSAMYRNEIRGELEKIKQDVAGLHRIAAGSVQLDDLTVKSLEAVERNMAGIKKRLTALESAHDCESH